MSNSKSIDWTQEEMDDEYAQMRRQMKQLAKEHRGDLPHLKSLAKMDLEGIDTTEDEGEKNDAFPVV